MAHPIDPRTSLGVALALLVICAIGCGRQESAAPAAAPAPVVVEVPKAAPAAPVVVEAETPDGKRVAATYTGESQEPAGLPEDLPLYAQAIPISSMASQNGGTIVNLRSGDGPDQVFAWYRDELPKRGWTVEKQSGAAGQHLVTALKGDRKATVVITAASGDAGASGTRILLTVLAEH